MRLFEGTEFDRPPHCDRCGLLESDCECPPVVVEPARIPPGKQTARLAVEKRKKGKIVTVIRGLDPEGTDLPDLLKRLKSSCGAGGSIDAGTLEIQGNHIERIRQTLEQIGFRVKG